MRRLVACAALLSTWAVAQPASVTVVEAWSVTATQRVQMTHRESSSSRFIVDDYLADAQLTGKLLPSGSQSFSGELRAAVSVSYSGEALTSSTSTSGPDCGLRERFSQAGMPGTRTVVPCFSNLELNGDSFTFSLSCDEIEIIHSYEWVGSCNQQFDYDSFIPTTWWWDSDHVLANLPLSTQPYPYPGSGAELSIDLPPQEATAYLAPWFTAIGTGENYPGTVIQQGTLRPTTNKVALVVEATPAYEDWRPTLGPGGAPGAALQLDAVLLDPDGAPAKGVTIRNIVWSLSDTSKEPGTTINFPVNAQDEDLDLELSPGSIPGAIDETRQKVTRVGLEATRDSIWIVPHDWGGWATLRVTCTLSTGEALTGTLSSTGAEDVLIPFRDRTSHIATSWKKEQEVTSAADDADDESSDGDGLTLYEEYRGIMLDGEHASLHPWRRDLVVHVQKLDKELFDKGVTRFAEAADLEGRITHRDDECEAKLTPRLNTNTRRGAHRVEQHAVHVMTGPADLEQALVALGDPTLMGTAAVTPTNGAITAQRGGTPGEVKAIYVFSRFWKLRSREEAISAIAHELGHATNLRHHAVDGAEVGPRRWVAGADGGIAEDGQPIVVRSSVDGSEITARLSTRLKAGGTVVQLGGRHGTNSGSETCLMRYTEADAFLSYTAPGERYAIEVRDPEQRQHLCASQQGETFNAPMAMPQTRFDSTPLGLCNFDVRVRDR